MHGRNNTLEIAKMESLGSQHYENCNIYPFYMLKGII